MSTDTSSAPVFLFSVDLEDVRDFIPDGISYREAVPGATHLYLNWLEKQNAKATFFVVGKLARRYPALIAEIAARGHEIACHTDSHTHLTNLSETEFRRDCHAFFDTIAKIGLPPAKGFRAPTFSMTGRSKWAYKVLHEFGFSYSSSVLPSNNPIFGWPGFSGEGLYDGIYELPMNIGTFPFKVPFGGGVYFRVLPAFVLKHQFARTFRKGEAVLSYLHPYDIDSQQERFMHPHLNGNCFLNYLMYVNRSKVFDKIDKLGRALNFKMMRYDEYLAPKIEKAHA